MAKNDSQLKAGIHVEREHEPTLSWLKLYVTQHNDFPSLDEFAKHIAEDHLAENPDYYHILLKSKL